MQDIAFSTIPSRVGVIRLVQFLFVVVAAHYSIHKLSLVAIVHIPVSGKGPGVYLLHQYASPLAWGAKKRDIYCSYPGA